MRLATSLVSWTNVDSDSPQSLARSTSKMLLLDLGLDTDGA
jgi:hypothetical protein